MNYTSEKLLKNCWLHQQSKLSHTKAGKISFYFAAGDASALGTFQGGTWLWAITTIKPESAARCRARWDLGTHLEQGLITVGVGG